MNQNKDSDFGIEDHSYDIRCVNCDMVVRTQECWSFDQFVLVKTEDMETICMSCIDLISDTFNDMTEFEAYNSLEQSGSPIDIETLLDGLTIDDILTQDDPPKDLYLMDDNNNDNK
jgi:hypothetical protein